MLENIQPSMHGHVPTFFKIRLVLRNNAKGMRISRSCLREQDGGRSLQPQGKQRLLTVAFPTIPL